MFKNYIYAYFQLKLFQLVSFFQQFQYIHPLAYLLTFSCTYTFHSLNILQHHTIYHIHTHNYQDSKPLSINSLHSHLHLLSFQRCLLLQTLPSNLHLHLHVSCHSICLVSLVLDIRLNTLTFTFLTILGTQFCMRIIDTVATTAAFDCFNTKGKKVDYLLVILTICGLILHSLLFIEIQLNKFTLVKVVKNANPVKKHFLVNPNILYCLLFSHTILIIKYL